MPLAWSDTRDALDAAVATASNADRPAILAAAAKLSALGARYAAAVSAGALQPVAGSVAADGAEPFRSGDVLADAPDTDPVSATAGWRRTAPGVYVVDQPARVGAVLRVEALLSGAAGNALAVQVTTYDGSPVVAVMLGGRVVERLRADANTTGRAGKLVKVQTSWGIPAELVSADTPSLAGGAGGGRQAVEFRAALALRAADEAAQRAAAADRERIALAVARVEAHRAALALPASSEPGATGAALELAVAAEMDAGARLLSYLAGPA